MVMLKKVLRYHFAVDKVSNFNLDKDCLTTYLGNRASRLRYRCQILGMGSVQPCLTSTCWVPVDLPCLHISDELGKDLIASEQFTHGKQVPKASSATTS